jgi:hypothetical protein
MKSDLDNRPVRVGFVKDSLATGQFSDAFAKFRKVTISFVMSVRPSIRLSAWNNSAPITWIFMIFDVCVFFEKMARKFKFL